MYLKNIFVKVAASYPTVKKFHFRYNRDNRHDQFNAFSVWSGENHEEIRPYKHNSIGFLLACDKTDGLLLHRVGSSTRTHSH